MNVTKITTNQSAAVFDGIRHTWKVGEGVTKVGTDIQGAASKDQMLWEAGMLDDEKQEHYAQYSEQANVLKEILSDLPDLFEMSQRKRHFEQNARVSTEVMVKMSDFIKNYFDENNLSTQVSRIALSVDLLAGILRMWMEVKDLESGQVPFDIEYHTNAAFKDTTVRLRADLSFDEDACDIPQGYLLAYPAIVNQP